MLLFFLEPTLLLEELFFHSPHLFFCSPGSMEEVPEGGCDSVVAGAIEVAGGTEVADRTEVARLRVRGVWSATMNCANGGRD
ncbi:hypothetical protein PVK06_020997 [Gossypium arboreum]|uniref:Uncharacterized protein n=1 Tax=Gossypium arboreum TaxID=29729 RepID=A0ABR0PNS9_GOSAR|nr:hypothetical protein PVK06_020997 [Gossypium arboreum]